MCREWASTPGKEKSPRPTKFGDRVYLEAERFGKLLHFTPNRHPLKSEYCLSAHIANAPGERIFMKKLLPYFKWYPADAETDEVYVSMTDEERGFYHHCLNVAWINGGLPADPAARARVLQRNRNQADARWGTRVASRFLPSKDHSGYLVNARQEQERVEAEHKSVKCAESVNHRYERTTSTSGIRSTTRARVDSDSDSDSDTKKEHTIPPQYPAEPPWFPSPAKAKTNGVCVSGEALRAEETQIASRFKEWLDAWPQCGDPDGALRSWISRVQPTDVAPAFAARDRYLASGQVKRGILMEPRNFINQQADCAWKGKWAGDPEQEAAAKAAADDARIQAIIAAERKAEYDQRIRGKKPGSETQGFTRISEIGRG